MRRWGPNAGNRALEKHVAEDIVAMLTELLHWKSCHAVQCARCVPINGATEAERMFGDRYKDLSPEDRRSYHRTATSQSKRRLRADVSGRRLLRGDELDP